MKLKAIFFLQLLFCVLAFKANAQQKVQVIFIHKVGNNTLQLFNTKYQNQYNEPFVVNKFKYYISNYKLGKSNKKAGKQKSYFHLVNEEDSTTKNVTFTVDDNADAIEFTIGVDSATVAQGVQQNDLDPTNGMFWTWNTGYVFAKLEGVSDSSKAPAHYFNYDVGGCKKNNNAIKKIVLPYKTNCLKKITKIYVEVDILKWFYATTAIKIADNAICHVPGKLAMQIANNYATMFKIVTVQ